MYRQSFGVRGFTVAALMAAVTAVFTVAVRIPVGTGYLNLSDVAIYFAAYSFGPWVGLIAGGLGTAIADVYSGYPEFAWLSLFAHGLQGLVVGGVALGKPVRTMVIAWFAGMFLMVSIYFIGEFVAMQNPSQALTEWPFNVLQTAIGGVIGIALTVAVRRAYPLVSQAAAPRRFREE
jgi:uncharacterized membrane protein